MPTPSTPASASTPAASTARFQETLEVIPPQTTNAPTAPEVKVHVVQSKEQLEQLIIEAGSKYIIIEFFADWCGPCRMIASKLDELAATFATKAVIIKVNVEELEDIAISYEVTSMPTFIFMKNKQKIGEIVGSNIEKILSTIEKVCSGEPFALVTLPPPTAAATPTYNATGETTSAPAATASTTTTKTPPSTTSTAEAPATSEF